MMSHHVTYSPIPCQFSSFRWSPSCTSSGCLHKNYVADYFPMAVDLYISGLIPLDQSAPRIGPFAYRIVCIWTSPSGLHPQVYTRASSYEWVLLYSLLRSFKSYKLYNLLIFACFTLGIGYFKTLRHTASE